MYTPALPWLGALNFLACADSSFVAMLTEAHPDIRSAPASIARKVVFLKFIRSSVSDEKWLANVEVTGAARLYRAASVWTAGLAGTLFFRQNSEWQYFL